MKRIFDFLLALIGLCVSAPFWILFALAIWFEDGRPVFYLQERVSKNGRIFNGRKFRSMSKTAESVVGPVQAKENDTRITKTGRILRATAMDELPQLWNILKGDMSFVGPRAIRPVEIDGEDAKPRSAWEFEGFKERSSVRPGLTGVAQVLAPRDISRTNKFKYDIWYIKNQSFYLDIKLIMISFLITFTGKWEKRQERFNLLTSKLRDKINSQKGA
ncbi:MAG: sugar transferase [Candidatus Omnitrophica bacterium]|nr:sugar transferase [Candidatus Omnitrophota bacterium]